MKTLAAALTIILAAAPGLKAQSDSTAVAAVTKKIVICKDNEFPRKNWSYPVWLGSKDGKVHQYNSGGPYAQVAGSYGIDNGFGGFAEAGWRTNHFRFGVSAGAGQRKIEGLDFISQTAGLKIGWDAVKTMKFSATIGVLGGYAFIKQKEVMDNSSWKSSKHAARAGAFLEMSYLFNEYVGIMGGIEFSGMQLEKKSTERTITTIDDNGSVVTQEGDPVVVSKTIMPTQAMVYVGIFIPF